MNPIHLFVKYALIRPSLGIMILCVIYYLVDIAAAGLPMSVAEWHELSKDRSSCQRISVIEERETVYNLLGWDAVFYINFKDKSCPRFVVLTPEQFSEETFVLWKKKGVIILASDDIVHPFVKNLFLAAFGAFSVGLLVRALLKKNILQK